MPVRLKNNARALLAVPVSATDVAIRVTVGKGERFPILGEHEWFPLVLEDADGTKEITRAIARAGDVITVERGRDGTEARPFPAGAQVSLRLTATALRSWQTGEDPPPEEPEGDPDFGGTGLIFNGLVANSYHTETGRAGYFHTNSGTSEGQYVFALAAYRAARALKYVADGPPMGDLAITGTLPGHKPQEAYEGRLTVSNAVGTVSVKQIAGDELPDGARIRIDPSTKQVVVSWLAAQEVSTEPLVNSDFEDGLTGWSVVLNPGTVVRHESRPGQAYTGTGCAVFLKNPGNYGEGADAVLQTSEAFRVIPGTRITGSGMIRCAEGTAGMSARTGLWYNNAQGQYIGHGKGAEVVGAYDRWMSSPIDHIVPDDAHEGSFGFVFNGANSQKGQAIVADTAYLVVPSKVGGSEDRPYQLSLQVTDSDGRVAVWTGTIGVSVDLFGHFDPSPSRTHTAHIALHDGNRRAVYLTTNDIPGSAATLTAPISGGGYADDRVFEWEVKSTAGRVYIGSSYAAPEIYNPASGAYNRTGAYVVFLGDGSRMMSSSGRGGSGWISPEVTGRYTDRFAMRVTTENVANQTRITHRFYQNGILRSTFVAQSVNSSSMAFMSVSEGGTTGRANSFDVRIFTDPAEMLHFSNYGGARGWPKES